MSYVIQGQYHPQFQHAIDTFLAQLPQEPRQGGAALTIYHQNQKVVDVWAGVRNKNGDLWQENNMAISYSTTKGVLSTLAHILVDEGLLAYDKPIADYWPAFAQNGKHSITLRHVLSHEAGLYHLRSMIADAKEMLDWPHMLQRIEQAKPLHAAGARVGYHAISFGWIVGGLIEKVTHEPLAITLAKKISTPLQLDGCYMGVPETELYRCTEIIGAARYKPNKTPPSPLSQWQQKITDKVLRATGFEPETAAEALIPKGMSRFYLDEPESLKACIPGAGGVFTARSLAKMYAVLANWGELDGVKLLSALTLKEATTVHNTQRGDVVPMPMHWRLGYHRVFTTWPRTPHAFGHFGYGGSGAWADPSRRLAVGYIVNTGSGSPFADLRLWRINTSIIQCVE